MIDVDRGAHQGPLELRGPPPRGPPATPLAGATNVAFQTITLLADRLLGRLGIRLPRQQLLPPFELLFQLLNPFRLLPVRFRQLPNPLLLVVTRVHPQKPPDIQKITKTNLNENRQLPPRFFPNTF